MMSTLLYGNAVHDDTSSCRGWSTSRNQERVPVLWYLLDQSVVVRVQKYKLVVGL